MLSVGGDNMELFSCLPWYLELQSIREEDPTTADETMRCVRERPVKSVFAHDKELESYLLSLIGDILVFYPILKYKYLAEWEALVDQASSLQRQHPMAFKKMYVRWVEFLRIDDFSFRFDYQDYNLNPFYFELVSKLDIVYTLAMTAQRLPFASIAPIPLNRMKRIVDLAKVYDIKRFLDAWDRYVGDTIMIK